VKYDALIFDLDGTLWDAAPASAEGWNRALAQLRLPIKLTVADIRSVAGNPTPRCFEILLPALCPLPETTFRLFMDREREAIERLGGALYDGVADGLHRLAGHYRLFLVSNCPQWYLESFFSLSGLQICFTDWDCHGMSGVPKSVMLENLRSKHVLARPVYVGDTEGDRDAAEQAGMDFVRARYGFGAPVASAMAFDSFLDLVAYFVEGRRPH
jgi:phosphoglycolate phosphatase